MPIYCKEPNCDEEFDREHQYAEHLAADHNQPDLLDQLEERYEEDHA